jgi:hypothetical protein
MAMKNLTVPVLLLLASALTIQSAPKPNALIKGIRLGTHTGWNNSFFFKGGKVEAVVVPAVGARILSYSLNGENILFEVPSSAGKVLDAASDFWVGGYQADVGPELANVPDHKALWMGPYNWESLYERGVRFFSRSDTNIGVQLEKEILMDRKTGELGLNQILRNTSDHVISRCLWDRTLCKAGGYALFPLNKKSRFPAGWSLRRGSNGKYTYDGEHPESPNVQILDGVLVAKTPGPETKIGADSDAGWIAYTFGNLLFIKYFPYQPGQKYTDGGNSVELYFDDKVAELEPLSAEIPLRPGKVFSFPEKWVLRSLKQEVKSFEEARALVSQIPQNPFGQ